jgi:hypothetical protein
MRMKKCDGNGLHPGEVIKYEGDWCPLCRLSLVLQHKDRTIAIQEKCLRYNQVVKPSRRRCDNVADTYEELYPLP